MKIYLAHPINGLGYEELEKYYTHARVELGGYYDILSPMTGKEFLRNDTKLRAEGYGNPVATNHAIFERDRWMVGLADVVYVNFEGSTNASLGCTMELAWASQLGKHTVIALPNENIHRHAFILQAADIVFGTHAEAIEYLRSLARV